MVEQFQTSEMLGWITYLKAKEERERMRMIEALSYVVTRLFPKEE